jgi:diaminohydroxyphosphoribosylaminopyrimidine deaminase/5-amino-6-(5-phosphoribosylamino)uracil reductase
MVGAVVVGGGEILGRGYHLRAGAAHAEVVALERAGARARGAELYVNLEPCNHIGRTGPCVRCVIEAGIRRVVVGMRDPNPLVHGKGIRALRRAGVEVVVVAGVLAQEAQELNEAFSCFMVQRRPFVTFKAAVTLDGRVAARSGDARWVTGEAARQEGHRLRDASDAIVVGVGTVLQDDPELTCRGVRGGRDPVRVVIDSRLRTPPSARVVAASRTSRAPTWIVTTERAPARRLRDLEAAGAVVLPVSAEEGRVAVRAMLGALAEREIMAVLLEGGPTLAGAFFRAGLVDRVTAFIAPKILGDPKARPMILGSPVATMAEARSLRGTAVRQLGDDLMVTGRMVWEQPDRSRRG